jgi:hypothetical protein
MTKFNTDYIFDDPAVQVINFPMYYIQSDRVRCFYKLKLNCIEENKKILSLEQDIISRYEDYKKLKNESILKKLFIEIEMGEKTINTLVEDKNAENSVRLLASTIGIICIENYTNDSLVQKVFEIFDINYSYNERLKVILAFLRKENKKVEWFGTSTASIGGGEIESGSLVIKTSKDEVRLQLLNKSIYKISMSDPNSKITDPWKKPMVLKDDYDDELKVSFEDFSLDLDKDKREEIALNSLTPRDVLAQLANDKIQKIVRSVVVNSNVSSDILKSIIENTNNKKTLELAKLMLSACRIEQ